ncbi:MAG: efflux RND transporter periplasmic adaptor subunit [Bacteroidales bacterium]|nr:efflux RND transporter periplasmic adaptor subunit [Bacteroidales bacterium]
MKINSVILLFLLLLTGCITPDENGDATSRCPVVTTSVQEAVMPIRVSSAGRISQRTEARLSFKTGGIISNIPVHEGEMVPEGKILARLDLSEIDAMAQQAALSVEKSLRDLERARRLHHDSVATYEQYQNAQTAYEVAKQNQRIAGFNLSHSVIKAPYQGRIMKKLAEKGEIVGPGMPIILISSNTSSWVIKVSITDKELVKIHIGDSANVKIDIIKNPLPGKVVEVGALADIYTGTFEVMIEITDPPKSIATGMLGNAEIYPLSDKYAFPLPMDALVEANGDKGYVIRVGKNNMPQRVEVELIMLEKERVWCRSDHLNNGDTIIIKGGRSVDLTQKVVVTNHIENSNNQTQTNQ